MSSPTATAGLPAAPFRVHSIHFDFPGGHGIRLREHGSHDFVGGIPEWVDFPPREALVVYVRAVRPFIRTVFRGTPAINGRYVVGADGSPCRVEEQSLSLTFDPVSGLSQPADFRLRSPLPDRIGLHAFRFDWYARDPSNTALLLAAGSSSHRIGTTWRAMVPVAAQGLLPWAYRQLMEWTCQWCEGQDGPKDICDAIIRNLPSSNLRYGIQYYGVREMLQHGGGMCYGWYQLFQQMAHCQGVFVHRRRFLVDWRSPPGGEELWCAIVICRGGLNQPIPTQGPSEFHDNDVAFPVTGSVALNTKTAARYRFWGMPGGVFLDGHCINFLEDAGRLYLYDACFAAGPFEIRPPLPPDDLSIQGGIHISSFKAAYLDLAVEYMLGSLYNGGVLVKTTGPESGAALRNGMTVRTSLIPDVANGTPGITFYWGE